MTVPHATWVLLARIVRPQGRRGEVLADIFTDFPEHFTERKRLFLRPPRGPRSILIAMLCAKPGWNPIGFTKDAWC